MAGGAGPSFAIHGAGPSSLLVGGAGPSLSTVGGVAGPLSFFMGGGAGHWSHCSWVVVVCPHWFLCGMAAITVVVVLSSLEGEGRGSFMSVDAPSIVVPRWRPASFPCAVVACPHSHVSSSSCVPHRCCVSSPCCCPLPSSSLSCNVVAAVPSL